LPKMTINNNEEREDVDNFIWLQVNKLLQTSHKKTKEMQKLDSLNNM
jgi:hypothetical protein